MELVRHVGFVLGNNIHYNQPHTVTIYDTILLLFRDHVTPTVECYLRVELVRHLGVVLRNNRHDNQPFMPQFFCFAKMVCPLIVSHPLGQGHAVQHRVVIGQSDVRVLTKRLRGHFKEGVGYRHDLVINCHNRFFDMESAHVMRSFLQQMGADDTSSGIFVFPASSSVRLIRMDGLNGLDDGRPSSATMPVVEESGIAQNDEAGIEPNLLSDGVPLDQEDRGKDTAGFAEEPSDVSRNDDDTSEAASEESEVDYNLSQEFW